MKITTFLLLLMVMTVSASTLAQRITLNETRIPLEKALDKVRLQSGYDFVYDAAVINAANPVTIHVKDADVEYTLTELLKGQSLFYQIKEQTVIIKAKELAAIEKTNTPAANIDVTGRVTDENNQPLAGATVQVKSGNNATSTDANGFFTLKGVQTDVMIVVSFLGFDKKEFTAAANVGQIKLSPATSKLDEVQVIAYGQTTQRLSVGNVTTVKAAEIENQPVTNPILALQGRVPGLFISQSTGYANSGVTVRVEGRNGLISGLDPLYVVDGVPYLSQPLPNLSAAVVLGGSGGTTATASGNGSALSFLDPSDIESISVLKDADATAIYGSRAANGAILITTKKGKAGRTKFDVTAKSGWQRLGRELNVLNTQQYLQMRQEAKKNDNSTILATDYDINGKWDTTRYTDWQKVLIGNTGRFDEAHVSISGGSDNTQFLMTAGLHRETAITPGNFSDKKASVLANITNTSTDKKFKFQLSVNYLIDDNLLPTIDLTGTAVGLAPDAPQLYNSDGSLNWAPVQSGTSTVSSWINPLSYLNNSYRNQTNNLISNSVLSYQLLPGLTLKSDFGYSLIESNELIKDPLTAVRPELRATTNRLAYFGNSSSSSWIIEPQISYHRIIAAGKLDALVGGTFQEKNVSVRQIQGSGYSSDLVLENIAAATNFLILSSVNSAYHYNAGFARINYSLQDKYILDLTARRDGSSRFGDNNLFHNFWSVGGAWVFSDEKWFKDNFPAMSFGKLRSSYGTTGNDQIGDYGFLNLYSPATVGVAYQGITAISSPTLPNPYLQWEETKKWQVGADLGFLNDRVLANVNYYLNRSSNLLGATPLSIVAGVSSINQNFPGIVQNSGWELGINVVNGKEAKLTWSTGLTLTVPKNRLVSFPNLANSVYANTYAEGHSLYDLKSYNYNGVDPVTGMYQYLSAQGTNTFSPGTADRTAFVDLSPKLFGGLQGSIDYKGFELSILAEYVKQNASLLFGNEPGVFSGTSNTGNQPATVLNRWRKPGDNSPIQKFSSTYPSALLISWVDITSSNGRVTDGSYIRLTNAMISWQIPADWRAKLHIQNAKIYLQGQNLFTITKYVGFSPVTNNLTALPPLQTIVAGVQLGF